MKRVKKEEGDGEGDGDKASKQKRRDRQKAAKEVRSSSAACKSFSIVF